VIHPTRRAILLAAAGFPVALLPALVHPGLWGAWLVVAALTLAAIGLDAFLALPPGALAASIDVPESLFVAEAGAARVVLSTARGAAAVQVLADLHADLDPSRRRSSTSARARQRRSHRLRARRRGKPTVEALWPAGAARSASPRGASGSRSTARCGAAERAPRTRCGVPLRARELSVGVQVERFVGDGSESDRPRVGAWARPRAISWKATARHRKLLAQEFRAERNHQVVLALDTGHLMAEPLEGVPRSTTP
jgi:uncharacterized protein (DUF58 family)